MHYEVHDSSGTPLLLLHGGLFDIHQQFGELLPGKLQTTDRPANHPRRPPETRPSTGLDAMKGRGLPLLVGPRRMLGVSYPTRCRRPL